MSAETLIASTQSSFFIDLNCFHLEYPSLLRFHIAVLKPLSQLSKGEAFAVHVNHYIILWNLPPLDRIQNILVLFDRGSRIGTGIVGFVHLCLSVRVRLSHASNDGIACCRGAPRGRFRGGARWNMTESRLVGLDRGFF